ncbi:nucleoside/nucleotide kinase family protein [Ornithinibacter aureus]|uniref:Nucleoside/nucleotide kinase family protein n=1 Tax=Ornithinibacter aureus TaxID=622664 RepID=A0ABP8J8P8_9MICO|nr:nucleoside/nucleotide kinase family protein [Ornithinibacter aureus]KAF0832914.1 phosphoribulokinase/uridine kinase family protein [Ornithinibacter aureus]
MTEHTDPVDHLHLVDRVLALRTVKGGRVVIIGIAGEPGAGKSTLAASVVTTLTEHGCPTVLLPMDGFHLANVALASLGVAERKGAPETFDAAGFAALLARIRAEGPDTVWAPMYDRSVEESIAGAIPVPPGTEVVVTEGNYLLVDEEPWAQVGELLDEVWAVRVDAATRTERLIARHVRYGRTPAEAVAWVASVDEPNAAVIRATLGRADLDVSTG